MGRPRTEDRHPLKRLLRAWARGEGVEPEHRDHLLAVAREATAEAARHDFGIFELVAAGMTLRLYGRSLASQDTITVARALGEVIRSLRALHLLDTASRLRGNPGIFSMPPARAPRRRASPGIFQAAREVPEAAPQGDDGAGQGVEDAGEVESSRTGRR